MTFKTVMLGIALMSAPTIAFAQTQPAPAPTEPAPAPVAPAPATPAPSAAPAPEKPAVATPSETNPNAPVKGENSFTEAQAKERITAAGYTDIGALALDSDGIWSGPAKKDGKDVTVQMDYQGNIVAK